MGATGTGLYERDCTQTCHYDFLDWAKIKSDFKNDDRHDYFQEFVGNSRKTKLPKEDMDVFVKNIDLVLKKMPKWPVKPGSNMYDQEDNAMEWQMLLSLFVDNGVKAPEIVYKNGIEATEWFMEADADDYDCPGARRRVLKNFIKKAEKNQNPLLGIKLPGGRGRWVDRFVDGKVQPVIEFSVPDPLMEGKAILSVNIEEVFYSVISKLNEAFGQIECQDIKVDRVEMNGFTYMVLKHINKYGLNKFIKRNAWYDKIWPAKVVIKTKKQMKFGQIKVFGDFEDGTEGVEINV